VSNDSGESVQPPEDVPYENTADPQWARRAMDLFRAHRLQVKAFDTNGVASAHVWGTCPRCGHDLNHQPTLTVPVPEARGVWAMLTGRAPNRPEISENVEVGCGCEHTHPGAPKDVKGCGVSFRLPTAPPPAASAAETPAAPPSAQDGAAAPRGPR
jgi:hypothetical protein